MQLLLLLAITLSMTLLLSAQGGQPKGGPAPASSVMTLNHFGIFPTAARSPFKFSQAAPGVAAGEGTSPGMNWANAPAGTQSFFLHMHDLDLARNKTTGRSGALGALEYSGDGNRLARRRTQGIAIAGRKLSGQRHRTHVPWSWSRCERSAPPLRFRTLRVGHQAGRETKRADAFETRANVIQSDPGSHSGKGGLRGTFPATPE